MDCDLLIIGSGFGGSVCALRAAQAGLRVIVLERGGPITPDILDQMTIGVSPIFHRRRNPGLAEIHRKRGLWALTASAVGGGSHLYTAVTVPAPKQVFDTHWPSQLNHDRMSDLYTRVEEVIQPAPIPAALPRTRALESVASRIGAKATRLPVAIDWPDEPSAMTEAPPEVSIRKRCTTWLSGGVAARKRTLDKTYLHHAERLGVQIRPFHEVKRLAPSRDGYTVTYRMTLGPTRDGELRAPRVVLAAGTLNTVRLLLGWRDITRTLPQLSPSLGSRFFTNGDLGALLIGSSEPLVEDSGPPVTGWIDHWESDRLYLMETGTWPFGIGGGRPAWSFGVMGFDTHPGCLQITPRGSLRHVYEPGRGEVFNQQRLARLDELAHAAGARLMAPPQWLTRRTPITVHPLGGAAMSESPANGVTNAFGEVFGHPGLFIADGSLMPTPTGVAPSMTIAAVAEHVAENLVQS